MCRSKLQHLLSVPTNSEITNQPLPFAQFKIHEIIEPMIPCKAANALSANLPNNHDTAFNLLFIHSLAPPPFLSPPLELPDLVVDTVGPPNKDSIKTPIAIPTAVNTDIIVIPCSLKRVLILSPSVPVSLSKNFVIDPLIQLICLKALPFKISISSYLFLRFFDSAHL